MGRWMDVFFFRLDGLRVKEWRAQISSTPFPRPIVKPDIMGVTQTNIDRYSWNCLTETGLLRSTVFGEGHRTAKVLMWILIYGLGSLWKTSTFISAACWDEEVLLWFLYQHCYLLPLKCPLCHTEKCNVSSPKGLFVRCNYADSELEVCVSRRALDYSICVFSV